MKKCTLDGAALAMTDFNDFNDEGKDNIATRDSKTSLMKAKQAIAK